jgi:pyruvate dehydrogenase (quinone)/pyruvate oxidase
VSLACRTALTYRGVAHVTIPVDVQSMTVSKDHPSPRNRAHHVSDRLAAGGHWPDAIALQRAASILNEGKKTVIMAGRGALGAGEHLLRIAELLAAPIVKPLLGKAAVPDRHPLTTGGVGLLGTKPSQTVLEDCDTLLIVGSSFPYIEFYPKPGQARCVQIEIDPQRIGLRCPAEVGLVGDARRCLDALLPLLKRNEDRAFLEKAQAGMKEWRERMEVHGLAREMPMKPQVVTYELNKLLADDAIIATDSGTITTWAARYLDIRGSQMFSLSGNLATMAPGLPYAVAAQIAYPDRQVVAVVGDGGITMLMGELATAVKYKLPIKIIVIKNNALGQIKWEQIGFLGNPEFGCELQPIDFAAVARAFGAHAFTITDPAQCGEILDHALATPGPVLIEAVVDPQEPPLPPTITMTDTKNFIEAIARGTPEGTRILTTVMKDKAREII